MSSIRFVIILFPLTLISKPACEDDRSFSDSFGWTCRDYGRVPEQCKFSKEWEKDGKTALVSCCVCRKDLKNNIIFNNFGSKELLATRRQSEECLTMCSAESETCSGSCEESKTECDSSCDEVLSTCSWLCEHFDDEDEEEEEENEEDAGGVVDDDGTATSNSKYHKQIGWYIMIVVLGLFVVCCSCFIAHYLIKVRVKTVDTGRPEKITREQVPMVASARNDQQVGDQYMVQQYVGHGDYPAAPSRSLYVMK